MGNQSTSGIAEESGEKGKSEEISSPKELKEENQIQIQENELNFQEKAEKEEHRGSDPEDCETQIVVEPSGLNLDEVRSRISNEEQDQLCTVKDLQEDQNVLVKEIDAHVVEKKEDLVEADTPSVEGTVLGTRVDKDCTPQEAVGITSQLQDDHDMLVKETDDHAVEKTEGDMVEADTALVGGPALGMRVDKDRTPQEEAVGITSDLQEDQIMLVKEIDDHVEDELVEADSDYVEGSLLDTCVDKDRMPQEAVGIVSDLQEFQYMLVKGIDDQVVEKHEYALTASVEAPLLETRVDKGCTQQEAVVITSVLQQDQNMLKEIDDHDLDEADTAPTEGALLQTCVDKECTPQEAVDTTSQEAVDTNEANTASAEGSSRIDNDELVKNDENPQEKQSNSFTTLNELQSISLLDSSAEENGKEKLMMNELGIDECDHPSNVDQSQPSDQEIKHLLNETPREMVKDPNKSEPKAHESTERHDFGSNTTYVGVQVELRKAPSFDFGLLFDARSEESDQTPLLFQDKAPMRSYSTCSNPRFQDRSVQAEYLGKYEGVEVEEKTIRMERSNSESSMAPPVNLLYKESNAGAVAKGKQENGDGVSPRGSGKRKPRSSLFTTCICCTAAIS